MFIFIPITAFTSFKTSGNETLSKLLSSEAVDSFSSTSNNFILLSIYFGVFFMENMWYMWGGSTMAQEGKAAQGLGKRNWKTDGKNERIHENREILHHCDLRYWSNIFRCFASLDSNKNLVVCLRIQLVFKAALKRPYELEELISLSLLITKSFC